MSENTTLADFTSKALIVPKLYGTRAPDVMRELGDLLHRENPTIPDSLFRDATVLHHELLTGLSLEFGAVFPKVIVPALPQPRFALGRSAEPLAWRAKWLAPVHLIFLVAGPSTRDATYQQLLAALASLGENPIRLESLRNAPRAEDMLSVLQGLPIKGEAKPVSAPPKAVLR